MKQSTFIMLKPDANKRNLSKEILDIFLSNGFEIIRSKEVTVDEKLILTHYKDVIENLKLDYLQGAILKTFVHQTVPIYEISKETNDIIHEVRTLVGATDPIKADLISIRGRYQDDQMVNAIKEKRMLRNLIHASDSIQSAQKEMSLWFDYV